MNTFQRVLLPGLAFQAVLIGGGYATGRELVAFFFSSGPLGGLIAMAITAFIMGATLSVCFAFAKRFDQYDYKEFFRALIGPGWILFEITLLLLLVLVLSIVGAAAGEIARDAFGVPTIVGTMVMIAMAAGVLFFGNKAVERLLSLWSIVLYVCFTAFFILFAVQFGDRMETALRTSEVPVDVFVAGLTYAGINVNCFVSVLFLLPMLKTEKEAIWAGWLAGPIAMIPGMLFFAAMMAFYPDIGDAAVPLNYMLDQLGNPAFALFFQGVIFITGMKTAVGMIHAVNDRVAQALKRADRPLPKWGRAALSLGLMIFSVTMAEWLGLVTLIDKGYGLLSWIFVVLIFPPVFTIGLWRLWRTRQRSPHPAIAS